MVKTLNIKNVQGVTAKQSIVISMDQLVDLIFSGNTQTPDIEDVNIDIISETGMVRTMLYRKDSVKLEWDEVISPELEEQPEAG